MTACGAFLHSLAKSQNALRNPCTTVFSAKGWAKLRQLADLRGRGSVGVIVVRFVGGPSVDIFAVELMRFGFGADAGMAGRASRPLSPGFRRSVAAPAHPSSVSLFAIRKGLGFPVVPPSSRSGQRHCPSAPRRSCTRASPDHASLHRQACSFHRAKTTAPSDLGAATSNSSSSSSLRFARPRDLRAIWGRSPAHGRPRTPTPQSEPRPTAPQGPPLPHRQRRDSPRHVQ